MLFSEGEAPLGAAPAVHVSVRRGAAADGEPAAIGNGDGAAAEEAPAPMVVDLSGEGGEAAGGAEQGGGAGAGRKGKGKGKQGGAAAAAAAAAAPAAAAPQEALELSSVPEARRRCCRPRSRRTVFPSSPDSFGRAPPCAEHDRF